MLQSAKVVLAFVLFSFVVFLFKEGMDKAADQAIERSKPKMLPVMQTCVEPEAGQKWAYADWTPFSKTWYRAKVLAAKDGWVQYEITITKEGEKPRPSAVSEATKESFIRRFVPSAD